MSGFRRLSFTSLFFLLIFSSAATAGRRPQMIIDANRIAAWIGKTTGRLIREGSDGVTVTKFRRIEVTSSGSAWMLKVNCFQKIRKVWDASGRERGDEAYDVPEPHGFLIYVTRSYSETRPKNDSRPWTQREDGSAVCRATIAPVTSPELWLTVYGERGSAITEAEGAVIDDLFASLRETFGEPNSEKVPGGPASE